MEPRRQLPPALLLSKPAIALLSKIRDAAGINLMHLVKEPSSMPARPLPYPITLSEFLEGLANRPLPPSPCDACNGSGWIPDHARFCAKCGRRIESTITVW